MKLGRENDVWAYRAMSRLRRHVGSLLAGEFGREPTPEEIENHCRELLERVRGTRLRPVRRLRTAHPGRPNHLSEIVSVFGRPVGVLRTPAQTALVAMERGYFPLSVTGSIVIGGPREALPPVRHLAVMNCCADEERAQVRREILAGPRLHRSPMVNHHRACSLAEHAIEAGFFARPAERDRLWTLAHRQLCRSETDPRFRPEATAQCGSGHEAAQAVTRVQRLRRFLESCGRGDSPAVAPWGFLAAAAYLRLPADAKHPPRLRLQGDFIRVDSDFMAVRPVSPAPDPRIRQSP